MPLESYFCMVCSTEWGERANTPAPSLCPEHRNDTGGRRSLRAIAGIETIVGLRNPDGSKRYP